MDINNNQQINTFTGGMNTDTSDMYIDSKQYRYAENIRIVTDTDNNSGEVRPIFGTKDILFSGNNETIAGLANIDCILDLQQIRDIVVGIFKNAEEKWAVFVIDNIDQQQATARMKRITDWFDEKIWPDNWDENTKPISTVLRYEDDNNIKLYIADGIHPLMALRFNRSLDLISGSFNDVFGVTTNGVLAPISVNILDTSGGNLSAVRLQYAYILYDAYSNKTTLSSLSKVVSVQNKNGNWWLGYSNTEPVNKSARLTIPSIDTNAQYIKIYRISYVAMGQLPTVDIIYDGTYNPGDSITDTGHKIESSSYTDLLGLIDLGVKPKLVESKNNYLFIGNVKYTQDEIDKKFENFDARCYNPSLTFTNAIEDPVRGRFTAPCDVCYSLVHNGWSLSLYEKLKNKTVSDLKSSSYSWTLQYMWESNDWVFPGGLWNELDQWWWMPRRNPNGIGTCFWWWYLFVEDDSDETPTYARNEVYRFGVRLFDKEGNASSVKWIADIKMPDYGYTDHEYLYGDGGTIKNRKIQIAFCPVNVLIENSPWKGVHSYEIVLCVRTINDSWNISQGLQGLTTHVEEGTRKTLCTPMFLTLDHFKVADSFAGYETGMQTSGGFNNNAFVFGQKNDYLLFASPETTYQIDDVNSIMDLNKNQIYIRNVSELTNFANYSIFTQNRVGYENIMNFRNNSALFHYGWKNDSGAIDYNSDICGQYNYGDGRNADWGMLVGKTMYPNNIDNPSAGYYFTKYVDLQTSVKNYMPFVEGVGTYHTYAEGGAWPIGKLHKYDQYETCGIVDMTPHAVSVATSYFTNANIDSYIPLVSEQNKVEDFSKDASFTFGNSAKTLNDYTYFQYTNPFLVQSWTDPEFDINDREKWLYKAMDTSVDGSYYRILYTTDGETIEGGRGTAIPMSHGGQAMLIHTNSQVDAYNRDVCAYPAANIANIIKDNPQCYGGYNDTQISLSKYISVGAVANVLGTGVVVNGGDVYILSFRYNHTTNIASNYFGCTTSYRVTYDVPIETRINLNAQCSDVLRSDNRMLQDLPTSIRGYMLSTPAYLYNTAYSVQPDAVIYTSAGRFSDQLSNTYDTRIHYSDPKINNEVLDSWTNFRTLNFIDVDSRYGELTGLKLFKDKLIFFQDRGAGVLSVNDRSIVQDTGSTSIVLGNGGVLERYDYFTTLYGMKPDQKAYAESNDMLYWWDGHSKEIIAYSDGYNINQLQRIKNVANYINKYDESDTPSIMYDRKNKEVLFNVVNNTTLVYNEQIQQFQSIYTFSPVFYCDVLDTQIINTQSGSFSAYNVLSEDGVTKLFGKNANPKIKYVVNTNSTYNKVFDNQTFGGRFYGGDVDDDNNIVFTYYTPLKQRSLATWKDVVNNYEYDYRLAIPRNNDDEYGGRMRGKTMECEISAPNNTLDLSLLYVTTKFRMSWT